MNQLFKLTILCLSFHRAIGAFLISDADSLRTYHAEDVIITATRSDIQHKDSPSPVQVISTHDIQRTNGSSVADILRSSESIFIKDQGPTASLKTISFRGMASEHIVVLLNGTRINNPQNGLVDFSLLPMQNVDRIEVVRGGISALYGADALGGIINIISARPSEKFQINVSGSFGSFDYKRYSLDMRGRILGIGIVAGVMHDQATGNYPYIFQRTGMADTIKKREGADFTRTQLYLNTDYSFDSKSDITLSLQRVKSNQGAPGSLIFISKMRQDDDAITTAASFRDNHLSNISLNLNLGWTYDLQQYYSQTKMTLITINPQIQWVMTQWNRFIVGGEFIEGHLEGMLPFILIKRVQRSLYLSNEMLFQRETSFFDRFLFYQSIRYDKLMEGEEAYSPKFGLNIRIVRDWETRIRASYGRNFRMPTFNDLYDAWMGNPFLKPEHSTSFDVGLETAIDRSGIHSLKLTYFDIDTKDRILLTHAGWNYFPVNIAQVQSNGIEGRYDLQLLDNTMNAFADVTVNDAIRRNSLAQIDSTDGKHLLYVPKTVYSIGVSLKLIGLQLNINHTYSSKRFITEDESSSLPPYSLTDINLISEIQFQYYKLKLRAEVSNLFDVSYQILPDYPMQGRTFRAGIGVDY